MELSHHPEDIDFQKYWQILKRHRVPASRVFLGTVILATLFALFAEKKYSAYGQLKFTKENATSALIAENGEKLGRLEPLKDTATPVDTEAEVVKSAPVVRKVIEQTNLTDDGGEAIDYADFLENLQVKNIPGTDVLSIAYESPDPQEAEKVVNSIIDVYLEQNIANNRAQAQTAKDYVIEQLPRTEAELQLAEAQLKTFQEQNNIVNLGIETELAANNMGAIDRQIEAAEVRLEKVNSQIAEIEQKLGITSQEALALNELDDSSSVQQVLTKLNEVEDRLAVERSRFKDNSPIIIDLEERQQELAKELQRRSQQSLNLEQANLRKVFQTGELQKQLAENLVNNEVQRQSLVNELNSLRSQKATSQQRNNLLPQLQQRYRELQRKTDVAQTAYKNLLLNLQQLQIIENQNVGNAQAIGEAVVGKYPVSTSRKVIVAGGLFFGTLLYGITAFLWELKDPSLKTTQDLRKSLNYKILTIIPNLEEKNLLGHSLPSEIPPESQATIAPQSLVSEAYRMLYTNLQFLVDNRNLEVITVTSSIPQEGKSTVSANLASTLARLGKNVLLIDGDLHQPRQHDIWQISNKHGLKEVLMGDVPLIDAIQSSPFNRRLEILPAGSNKIEYSLLQSKRISQLLALCRMAYDVVIVDTPPVLLFSDTLTIANSTDGVILVTRLGVTNPTTLKNAQELLEQAQQNIFGIVVNGVEEEPENYYQYKQYYDKAQSPEREPKLLYPSGKK